MMEWLSGASSDTRNNNHDDDDDDGGMQGSPFALLSASAYVITRVQLHASFTIFFQACISHDCTFSDSVQCLLRPREGVRSIFDEYD